MHQGIARYLLSLLAGATLLVPAFTSQAEPPVTSQTRAAQTAPAPIAQPPADQASAATAPDRYSARRQRELVKRSGYAKSELERALPSDNLELMLKSKRNAMLSERIKIKLLRHEAEKARAQAKRLPANDPQRASLLGVAKQIEQVTAQATTSIRQEEEKNRQIGEGLKEMKAAAKAQFAESPANRLWNAPSPKLLGPASSFEELTGSQPCLPDEVAHFLDRLPGTGRAQQVVNETTPDGMLVTWKLVRTGMKDGKPQGYIWSQLTEPTSGMVITQLQGTQSSWARRNLGKQQVGVTMRFGMETNQSGNVTVAPTTITTFAREDLGDSQRSSVYVANANGTRRVKVQTTGKNGQNERFESAFGADGSITEQLVRSKGQGQWEKTNKVFHPQAGVVVREEDSQGRKRDQAVTIAEQAPRLKRVMNALTNPTAIQRTYKGENWTWSKEVATPEGALGTVAAYGERGQLAGITTGYVSLLGTRYGEVTQQIQQAISLPKRKGQKPETTISHYAAAEEQPAAGPKLAQVDGSGKTSMTYRIGQEKLQQAVQLVNLVRERPIQAIVSETAPGFNAYANPMDNEVFPRTSRRQTKTVRNVDQANIGAAVLDASLAAQVGVILHEGGHELDSSDARLSKTISHKVNESSLTAVGRLLGAEIPKLLGADHSRTAERFADTHAGTGLAKVSKLTKDESMDPEDLIGHLDALGAGRQWNPESGYDSNSERARTLRETYEKEMKNK